MLPRYRILRSMLALGEFTVADLLSVSGAQIKTIRSALRRIEHDHPDVLERSRPERTGKRGGAWVRYKVSPSGASWLEEEVARLEPRVLPPEDLLAAQDILLNELPRESDAETRAWIRDRARRLLDSGRRAGRRPGVPAHVLGIELQLRLADAEEASDHAAWHEIATALVEARTTLESAATPGLYEAVRQRLWSSVLADPEVCEEDLRSPPVDRHGGRLARALAELLAQLGRPQPSVTQGLGDTIAAASDDLVLVVRGATEDVSAPPPGLEAVRVDCGERRIEVLAGAAGAVRVVPAEILQELEFLRAGLGPSSDTAVSLSKSLLGELIVEQSRDIPALN